MSTSVKSIFDFISLLEKNITIDDIPLLRENKIDELFASVSLRIEQNEWEKLDKALKTEINSDSYIKLAKNYYGEDFNKYLESYETASIEELKASMGSEDFYQTLKEYISGICPAFSYDMNK